MSTAESEPVPRRGRPALRRATPLERDEIVGRALTIVRAEGIDALSMRRLAKDLDVSTMAIYHHVTDKPELMDAMLGWVWLEILERGSPERDDPLEFIVSTSVTTRQVWLEHFDLASLAVAVLEPDETLWGTVRFTSSVFEAAGFPDVPLAYSAIQNFTMGAIEIEANRRSANAYFGRESSTVLAEARALFDRHGASDVELALLDARFDVGDDRYFEPALRALIAGLLAG